MSLAPLAPSSQLAPGFRLDRYELLCPIAEGGMATVWVARQTGKHGFEKLVAIKTILPKFAADPAFQKMFRDEARIASRIEHTNAAQILDVGEQHDMTYLVMEYVDGDALSAVYRTLKKQNLKVPPGVVLRVLADACGALHTAHELRDETGALLNVVHRDVSPQNLLVSTKGVAKIIDFGIAKARDRVSGDTNSGQVKGKVRYMAPEQALGRTIDRRADIWAVGAILYHMLAGKPPYDGETDVQALMALTSGKPPVPLPQTVPAPVVEVVKRALKPSPEARYATAAEMQQAIEEAMASTKLSTSSAAIATFLGKHVSDRIQKRKDAIALGLKAAAERDRVAEVMRSNAEIHVGSLSATGAGSGSAPRMITATGAHSTITSGTLGSAAIDLGAVNASKNRAVILAAVGGGAFVGLAGMLAMFLHASSPSTSAVSTPALSGAPQAALTGGAGPQGSAMAARDAGSRLSGLPATPVIEATDLPVLPASALPKAPPPAYAGGPASPVREASRPVSPAGRPSPPPQTAPAPASPAPAKKRTSVDDGF